MNPDNSSPRWLDFHTNSKQNWFPLDLPHTFNVILTPITQNLVDLKPPLTQVLFFENLFSITLVDFNFCRLMSNNILHRKTIFQINHVNRFFNKCWIRLSAINILKSIYFFVVFMLFFCFVFFCRCYSLTFLEIFQWNLYKHKTSLIKCFLPFCSKP